jgi:RHS repeat-associated protein
MNTARVLRWLGLDRAGDFFFALRDATATLARRALAFGPPPGKPRRTRTRCLDVQPAVEQLEPRWVLTQVMFSASTYSVNESASTATVTVTLDSAPTAPVTVNYGTLVGMGDTAIPGTDYTATSGTLSWAPNDPVSKSFTVPILNDGAVDSSETASLQLTTPTGATLGTPFNATLTINETNNPSITEYYPPIGSEPQSIALGPGPAHLMWFLETGTNQINSITSNGSFRTTPINVTGGYVVGPSSIITLGPDGALWYSEDQTGVAGAVGRVTTSGSITDYPLASWLPPQWQPPNSLFQDGLAWGADGRLYVGLSNTSPTSGNIAQLTYDFTTNPPTLTSVQLYGTADPPTDLTQGPDGNIWFTEGAHVGRLTPAGVLNEWAMSPGASNPIWIGPGPDGNVYFTDSMASRVSRVTPTGKITDFAVPAPPPPTGSNPVPLGITGAPDGNVWFADKMNNQIDQMTPGGSFTGYGLNDGISTGGPVDVAVGADGNLWFTEWTSYGDAVAKMAIPESGTQRVNDPVQGASVPFGSAQIYPQNGNVQLQQPLDPYLNTDGWGLGTGPALVYNSQSVPARPILEISVPTDSAGSVPSQISVRNLTFNGTSQPDVSFATTGHSAGDTYALAVQVANPVSSTGYYPWSATVQLSYSNGTITLVHKVAGNAAVVVNGSGSAFGQGWSLAGLDQIVGVSGGVLYVSGTGGARFFADLGGGAFLNPANNFGILTQSPTDHSYTYTAKDQVKWHFSSSASLGNGQLTSVTDPHNLAITYSYSGGNLQSVAGPDGGVATFAYTGGKLSSVAEAGGRTVTVTVNGNGDLTNLQLPDSGLRTFGYDTGHRLTGDQYGPLAASYAYNATTGGVATATLAGGNLLVSPANAVALATSPAKNLGDVKGVLTDPNGNVSSYTYDPSGRVTKLEQPLGVTWRYQRDAAGQPVQVTDPRGNVTSYLYDYAGGLLGDPTKGGLGDLTKVSNPDGSTWQYTYHPTFHKPTVVTDGNGNKTTSTYDATTGDLLTVQDALGKRTTYTYYQNAGTSNGLVQTLTDRNGNVTSYGYDSSRRMTTMIAGFGSTVPGTTVYNYTAIGNLLSVTDPDNHVTSYGYDAMRRVTTMIAGFGDPAAATTQYAYDAAGQRTAVTDANGNVTSYGYDSAGRMTTLIQGYNKPEATTTTMQYDLAGNLLSRTTGYSTTNSYKHVSVSSYGYDALNRQTTAIMGFGTNQAATVVTAYDLNSNVLSVTDANGNVTTYGYDVMNRQVTVIQGSNKPEATTSTMQYDLAGNLVSRTTGYSTTDSYKHVSVSSYGYDALNRQTTAIMGFGTGQAATVVTAYDPNGNVLSVTDANGNVTTYGYDARNRQVTAIQGSNKPEATTTTSAYDAAGNLLSRTTGYSTTVSYRHVSVSSYGYDALNRQTTAIAGFGTSQAATVVTAYDANGNVLSVTDANTNVTTYGYDALNRQVTVIQGYNKPEATTATMQYDAAGNLVSKTTGISTYTAYAHVATSSYGYDALNRQTTAIMGFGTGQAATVVTAYDANGNVLSVTDANTNVTTYGYDALNRQVTAIQGSNKPEATTTTSAYDAAGNLLSRTTGYSPTMSYSHPSVSSYGYDALNRQTTAVAGFGTGQVATVVTAYDANGNVLSVTDANTNVTTYGYDALNRQVTVIQGYNKPEATTATMQYDAASNLVSRTTGSSSYTTYAHLRTDTFSYDALNRQTGETQAVGAAEQRSRSTAYDSNGNVTSATDWNVTTTSYAYNALNQLTTLTEAANTAAQRTATSIYDAAGNLLSRTTGISATSSYAHKLTTSYGYDALNRQTTVITGYGSGLDSTATMLYDAGGNLLSKTTGYSPTTSYSHVRVTSYGYDALNRLTTQIDGFGSTAQRTTSTVYDAAGNAVVRYDGLRYATTTAYDALDRPTTVTDPLTHVRTTAYDRGGNVTSTTDANNLTTYFSYDALNRRTATKDPRAYFTTVAYDAAGDQVSLTDASAQVNVTTMAYDLLGRLTKLTDPVPGDPAATFAYDGDGNQTATTDRDGRRRTATYDELNRPTGEKWYDSSGLPTNTRAFSYDAGDDQLTATDGSSGGGYTLNYDALGRMTAQQGYGQTLTMAYDAAANRTNVQDSLGGVTTSLYDALDRLSERDFGGAGQTALKVTQAWTADDELLTLTRYQGSGGAWVQAGLSTYGYDAARRTTSVQAKDAGGANISNFVYGYDLGDRLTTVSLNGTAQATYGYDNSGELTGDGVNTLTFDGDGNRTGGGYSTGPGNELTGDGTWAYSYDPEGNLTKKSKGSGAETWTYGYNNRDRLVWAKDAATDGGATLTYVTYKYDAWDRRIEEDVWTSTSGVTVTTDYAYDGPDVWADTNGSGALQTRRLYSDAVDAVLARVSGGGTAAWYLPDPQGSVRDIESYAGTADLDHLDYDGWGNATESNAGNGDRYKYTGREWDDAVKLQYNRARYYDPKVGRWTSQDPAGFDAGDSNLYRYVNDGPTDATDPSGKDIYYLLDPNIIGVPPTTHGAILIGPVTVPSDTPLGGSLSDLHLLKPGPKAKTKEVYIYLTVQEGPDTYKSGGGKSALNALNGFKIDLYHEVFSDFNDFLRASVTNKELMRYKMMVQVKSDPAKNLAGVLAVADDWAKRNYRLLLHNCSDVFFKACTGAGVDLGVLPKGFSPEPATRALWVATIAAQNVWLRDRAGIFQPKGKLLNAAGEFIGDVAKDAKEAFQNVLKDIKQGAKQFGDALASKFQEKLKVIQENWTTLHNVYNEQMDKFKSNFRGAYQWLQRQLGGPD